MYTRCSGAADSTAVRGQRDFGRGRCAAARSQAEGRRSHCMLRSSALVAVPEVSHCRSILLQCHDAVRATVQPCNRIAATPSSCGKLLFTHRGHMQNGGEIIACKEAAQWCHSQSCFIAVACCHSATMQSVQHCHRATVMHPLAASSHMAGCGSAACGRLARTLEKPCSWQCEQHFGRTEQRAISDPR